MKTPYCNLKNFKSGEKNLNQQRAECGTCIGGRQMATAHSPLGEM